MILSYTIAKCVLVVDKAGIEMCLSYDSGRQLIFHVCPFTYKEVQLLLYVQTACGLVAVNAGGTLSIRVKLMCSKG